MCCRGYCVLKNPISHWYIKSKDSILVNFKQIKRHPKIIKLNLKLSLNEVFIIVYHNLIKKSILIFN